MHPKDHSLPDLDAHAAFLAAIELPAAGRYAFIEAAWHGDIVAQAREAFVQEMAQHGVQSEQIDVFGVPGAFEIPLHAQRLIATGRYQAVVGCALVVDGGIYRHEFVAAAVIDALMRVQLDSGVPVISAVLTPHHFHEHLEHRKYFQSHFAIKGVEAARACVTTVSSLHKLASAT